MNAIEYIYVRGFPAQSENAVFQGLGGSAQDSGGVLVETQPPTSPISEDATVSDGIWTAQGAVIEAEAAYLRELADQLVAKEEVLPQQSFLESLGDVAFQEIIESVVGSGIAFIGGLVGSPALGLIAGEVAEIAVALGFLVYDYLKTTYRAGKILCERLAKEDDELLNLENTRDNYFLRSRVLEQHSKIIQALLTTIGDAENQTGVIKGMDVLIQAVQDLKYNNIIVEGPDGRRLVLQNSSVSEELP